MPLDPYFTKSNKRQTIEPDKAWIDFLGLPNELQRDEISKLRKASITRGLTNIESNIYNKYRTRYKHRTSFFQGRKARGDHMFMSHWAPAMAYRGYQG